MKNIDFTRYKRYDIDRPVMDVMNIEPIEFRREGITVGNSKRILYTASGFAKSALLHLQEVGELYAERPHSSHRSGLPSYLFFLVLSGSGFLTYEQTTYPLSAGDCVFIDCQKPYTHTTSDQLWQLKWCHFYGPTMESIYNQYTEHGGQPFFHPSNLDMFDSILTSLYQVAESSDYIRDMKINECLTTLLTLLMQESWRPDIQRSNTRRQNILPIRTYLNTHYHEKITLDNLSELFYLNKFYMMRLFKEQFGLSINHYLQQIRITKAKQLLRFSDKNVELIGLECGLGSHSYFTRIFKKVEGIPPSAYREQWQNMRNQRG